MVETQNDLYKKPILLFYVTWNMSRHGHYFIWQLAVSTSCWLIYCVNIVHRATTAHTCGTVTAGSDKWWLSAKFMTLYKLTTCFFLVWQQEKHWFITVTSKWYLLDGQQNGQQNRKKRYKQSISTATFIHMLQSLCHIPKMKICTHTSKIFPDRCWYKVKGTSKKAI